MKEAFEKIRKRIEEIRTTEQFNRGKMLKENDYTGANIAHRGIVMLNDALSIVSEVEAEYGNGKTNADHIRAMSDEELAEFLIYSEENYKLFTSDGKDFYTYEEALKHEIEWLKSFTTD